MSKRLNSPKSNYSSIRNRKRSNSGIGYGETLFKVLFVVFLISGLIVSFVAFFTDEYLTLVLTLGVNTILFSFLFKFMESVILLLKDIKKELKN
ncbi:MAG TPA: hypothetical protein DCL80_03900 [Balneola sp.]|jgi:ABC-type multidrug transport system permease subunit|nr:hypothetical protein [Balneola sp.]MAO77334.1 hypothetical protein [Balneola sp.]HAH50437.1 hypothetical protein [Balneola sp.]HBZ39569.1 hypothetical protein [Balneola sp.]